MSNRVGHSRSWLERTFVVSGSGCESARLWLV